MSLPHAGGLIDQTLGWAAMIVAMMPVLLLPMASYVWRRSFTAQRLPNATALLTGYLAIWLIAATVFTMSWAVVASSILQTAATPCALAALAAVWQVSPAKRWAWERCHQSRPIRGQGIVALMCCARLGIRHSSYCVLTCLPVMAAAMAMPSHRLAMLAAMALICYERLSQRPHFKRSAAAILVWAAVDVTMRAL